MIEIKVDTDRWGKYLTDLERIQIPFATSKALNSTALDIQRAERNRLLSVFTIRRPEWANRNIKITHFATKRELWATVGIVAPGDGTRSDILGKFENQTEKRPRGEHIAIPIHAKRNARDIVTRANRPRQIIEAGRAFIVKSRKAGVELIARRLKQGQKTILQTLYLLVRRAPLTPNLKFVDTAKRVVDTRFDAHMDRELVKAIRTAK